MDPANLAWWESVRRAHPDAFHRRRVLEVGSGNVNGSVRHFFTECDYTGVDWRAAPDVDVICLAHDMAFEQPFDVIISASMLEHDPYWRASLDRMVDLLKPDGILMLSWGAAHNPEHNHDTAPDGLFHALPVRPVLDLLAGRGLRLERCVYAKQVAVEGSWGEACCVFVGAARVGDFVPLMTMLIAEDGVEEWPGGERPA
jgi:SAM-dependent methyltransferase